MKKLILIMLLLCEKLSAPPGITLLVVHEPVNTLWWATCEVESRQDPLAYCIDVNGLPSIGISQIQYSRVKDYNERTGDTIKHSDCFDPKVSKRIFNYYASLYNSSEEILRCWNGGPKGMQIEMTKQYYQKVKRYL